MKQTISKTFLESIRWVLFVALTLWTGFSHATELFTFEDSEKPKPEFTRDGGVISAKLIPRAKSTSVIIQFSVASGGKLMEVKGVDFQTVDRPEVNVKNFKSAAFEIRAGHIPVGGEVRVSISSDFFTSSTAFYVFNPNLDKPWIITQSLNLPKPERMRELLVTVVDGGPMDADGKADGSVILIGGPRDSFWGYALGTLFIRFFGIFIVLTILMIGMILSGFVFRRYEQWKKDRVVEKERDSLLNDPLHSDNQAMTGHPIHQADEEEIAAIAAALYFRFQHRYVQAKSNRGSYPIGNTWASEGRKQIMNDRTNAFNRFHRFNK